MRALSWLGQFLLMLVALVLVPLVMLLALPFTSDTENEVLPSWLSWLNTYDDPGYKQGMYEKQVKWWYDTFGWRAKTWYWLGWRNQCYTLFWMLAPKVNFYGGAKLITTGPHYKLVQDGKTYFDYEWKYLGVGWKLFAIERFLAGDKTGNPDYDRPTFLLRVIRQRKK